MNKFFEAVKKGGDHWFLHMDPTDSMAHARNRIKNSDDEFFRMKWCEMFKDSRRFWQLRG